MIQHHIPTIGCIDWFIILNKGDQTRHNMRRYMVKRKGRAIR